MIQLTQNSLTFAFMEKIRVSGNRSSGNRGLGVIKILGKYFTPLCSCSWLHNNNNHVAFFVKRTHFIQENHQFIQYFRSLVHSFIVFSSGVKKIAAKNKCIIVLQIQATYQLYTLRCQKHFQITRQKKNCNKLMQKFAMVLLGRAKPAERRSLISLSPLA